MTTMSMSVTSVPAATIRVTVENWLAIRWSIGVDAYSAVESAVATVADPAIAKIAIADSAVANSAVANSAITESAVANPAIDATVTEPAKTTVANGKAEATSASNEGARLRAVPLCACRLAHHTDGRAGGEHNCCCTNCFFEHRYLHVF